MAARGFRILLIVSWLVAILADLFRWLKFVYYEIAEVDLRTSEDFFKIDREDISVLPKGEKIAKTLEKYGLLG